MRTKEEAIELFKPHPTTDESTLRRYRLVSDWFVALVEALYNTMPDGPGKTYALRKLQDAHAAVNAAIANKGQ